jgi:hypothetical protein
VNEREGLGDSRLEPVPLFAGLSLARLAADIPEIHDRIETALDARLPAD